MKKFVGYAALASLIAGLVVIWLLLRKPSTPFVEPSEAAAQSFNDTILRLTAAQELGLPAEARFTAPEINSQIQAWLKANPPPPGAATLKNGSVQFEGDRLTTVLALNVKGIDLYLSLRGHLALAKNTLRFIPAEARLGSLPVPVSWLEGKIDLHMELPEALTAVRVENGELVIEAD